MHESDIENIVLEGSVLYKFFKTLSLCLQALIVNTTNPDCEPGLGMESFIKINNLGVPINEN